MENLAPVIQDIILSKLCVKDKLSGRMVCQSWRQVFERNLRVRQTKLKVFYVVKTTGSLFKQRELNGVDKIPFCCNSNHSILPNDYLVIFLDNVLANFDPEVHFENHLVDSVDASLKTYQCLRLMSTLCPNVSVLVTNIQQGHWIDSSVGLTSKYLGPDLETYVDDFIFRRFTKLSCLTAPNIVLGFSRRFWSNSGLKVFSDIKHISVQSVTNDILESKRLLFPHLERLDSYEFAFKVVRPESSIQTRIYSGLHLRRGLKRISCPVCPSLSIFRSYTLPNLELMSECPASQTLECLGPVYLSRKTVVDFGVKVPTFPSLTTLKVMMRPSFPILKLRRILETNKRITSLSLYFSGDTASLDDMKLLFSGQTAINIESLEYSCLESNESTFEFIGQSLPNLKDFTLIFVSVSTFSLSLYRVLTSPPVIKRSWFPRLQSFTIHFVKSFPKVHFIKPFLVPLAVELLQRRPGENTLQAIKKIIVTSDGSAFFHFPRRSSCKLRSLEGVTSLVRDANNTSDSALLPLPRHASYASILVMHSNEQHT